MKRRIRKVYVIEMEVGLMNETLKIIGDKDLLEQYMNKYVEKYPHNRIIYKEVDYVETI